MIADALKISFFTYLGHLSFFDYAALIWYIVTFLCVIILAIVIVKRSSSFSLFLIVIALFFFIFAPFVMKNKLNAMLRPTEVHDISLKRLTFSDTVIVEASIRNTSTQDFNVCLLQVSLIEQSPTEGMKAYLSKLKPIVYQSILSQQPLLHAEQVEHKIVFDNFTYEGELQAYIVAECY